MLSTSALLIILIILFFFSAFFSGSEAAFIALNKIRLRHHMQEKRPGAFRIYGIISRMDRFIATILIGNNLINTAIAAIATVLFTRFLGEGNGLFAATLVITVFLVIFGDLIPKVVATNHPEGVAFLVRHAMSFLIFVFTPVANSLTFIGNGFIRLFGGNPHYRSPLITEEEMKMMIRIGKEEGFYGDNERKMLERIFHFDEIEVRDVMTSLEKMAVVPVDAHPDELERVLLEEGHSRIPVYKGDRNNIVGIIYVRDLLYLFKNNALFRLGDLLNAPFFVSPAKRVTELLKEFQANKVQIAIVRDPKTEKAIGLVTLEDLFEEIVGEIEEKTSVVE
ncbi:MAG: HlyC/CorC family transporter [Candidatus Omnitrophica bacterium]|nr:HlyC/CorC family transporter [Candidatus Omnitrophota bacterium]